MNVVNSPVELDDAAKERRYREYTKPRYQQERIASDYDAIRWSKPRGQWSNRRKLRAVTRAIDRAAELGAPIKQVLDLPCGTGRMLPLIRAKQLQAVESDLSFEMMQAARAKLEGDASTRFVRSDAVSLPFRDGQFDAVMSIRFLFHLPPRVRKQALVEMARVSRKWLIIDYRHKYAPRHLAKRLLHRLHLTSSPGRQTGRADLEEDCRQAGVEVVAIFPTLPFFLSDKWVVLGRKLRPS
jgi:SAM-dependent methyltransferase